MKRKQKPELTWIGKEDRIRLESHVLVEDPELSYAADRSAVEGDACDNRLVFGDNLPALAALEEEFAGQIQCIYIDPPYNTRQALEHYDDGMEHSLWLSFMRDRLVSLRRLLHRSGSLFIHIDDNELGYLIAVADEIFGRGNRIAVITFKQSSASGPKAMNPGVVSTSSFLLWYARDRTHWVSNRGFAPTARDRRYGKYIVNFDDPHAEWRLDTVLSAFARSRGVSATQLRRDLGESLEAEMEAFVLADPHRVVRTARVQPKDVNPDARARLEESVRNPGRVTRSAREGKADYFFLDGEQLLFYSSKTRLLDGQYVTGEALSTIWDDLLSNNLHKEGGVEFPNGKKPEQLLKRILELTTRPGDRVLDAFAGSGTTGAVAHKMGRRWIMVEQGEHLHTHVVPRMRRVIDGDDASGITKAVGWKGGGGFRYFRLAPPPLEADRGNDAAIELAAAIPA